ncbi:hypothetical protein BELL_0036g00010 [Botrytis elliptica]|uniref:Uncharacterized protein n=1 Tax=Botrytis elliptica TaxID=278938 RepID=A0A4Z1K5P2_9HELO|nr:hypothetical protein BELL_0036g00010 [Botrytis elliptica]
MPPAFLRKAYGQVVLNEYVAAMRFPDSPDHVALPLLYSSLTFLREHVWNY